MCLIAMAASSIVMSLSAIAISTNRDNLSMLDAATTATYTLTLTYSGASTSSPGTTTNSTKLGNKLTFYNYAWYGGAGYYKWKIYNKSPFKKITKVDFYCKSNMGSSVTKSAEYYFGTSVYTSSSSMTSVPSLTITNNKHTFTPSSSTTCRYFCVELTLSATYFDKVVITYSC